MILLKNVDFLVLPWGVLDGTVQYSSLSRCLVSSGRRAPLKVCYSRWFYHSSAQQGWADREAAVCLRLRSDNCRRAAQSLMGSWGHGYRCSWSTKEEMERWRGGITFCFQRNLSLSCDFGFPLLPHARSLKIHRKRLWQNHLN